MPSSSAKQRFLHAYHENGLVSDVESATPHGLITLLFNGAITRIQQAKRSIETGNIALKGESTGKAISIIEGLNSALDSRHDMELAAQLQNVYTYIAKRLLDANINNDLYALEEAEGLVRTLRQAWEEMPETVTKASLEEIENRTLSSRNRAKPSTGKHYSNSFNTT